MRIESVRLSHRHQISGKIFLSCERNFVSLFGDLFEMTFCSRLVMRAKIEFTHKRKYKRPVSFILELKKKDIDFNFPLFFICLHFK